MVIEVKKRRAMALQVKKRKIVEKFLDKSRKSP
jgi:hypothetical protein